MEIQGKIIAVLPERSGVSARGEWKCQTYVIETQEQYPKKMAFDVFGADRIVNFGIRVGMVVDVSFDIDAHEYQGRYFNQIRAWDVKNVTLQNPTQGGNYGGNAQAGAQAAQPSAAIGAANPMNSRNPFPPVQQPGAPAGKSDDIPF